MATRVIIIIFVREDKVVCGEYLKYLQMAEFSTSLGNDDTSQITKRITVDNKSYNADTTYIIIFKNIC